LSDATRYKLISVVLPTYNEAENIVPMIAALREVLGAPEIIVVDDDSPDMTWKLAEDAGARAIRRIGERGLASAIKRGVEESSGDIIVWMDCDMSMPPSVILKLAAAMEKSGADIAVGSRYAPGGRDARPFMRRFTSRAINIFANVMLPVKVRDYDSGFVAVARHVFDKVTISGEGYGEYCIEFLCHAGLAGFKITEIGYEFTDRRAGKSKTAAGGTFSYISLGFQYARRVIAIRRML
jgi:dolichol-phosphate mannosyltransferase